MTGPQERENEARIGPSSRRALLCVGPYRPIAVNRGSRHWSDSIMDSVRRSEAGKDMVPEHRHFTVSLREQDVVLHGREGEHTDVIHNRGC